MYPTCAALLSVIFSGQMLWPLAIAEFITTLSLNAARELLEKMIGETFTAFTIDKVLRLAAIVGLSVWFPLAVTNGYWATKLQPGQFTFACQVLVVLSGFCLCVPMAGQLIGKATGRFTPEINKITQDGLTKGGQYIGWLERLLIFQFLLLGSVDGVGFLLGAKSILRFGEISGQADRKVTEYIIIGTFLSFGLGTLMAGLTAKAIALPWKP